MHQGWVSSRFGLSNDSSWNALRSRQPKPMQITWHCRDSSWKQYNQSRGWCKESNCIQESMTMSGEYVPHIAWITAVGQGVIGSNLHSGLSCKKVATGTTQQTPTGGDARGQIYRRPILQSKSVTNHGGEQIQYNVSWCSQCTINKTMAFASTRSDCPIVLQLLLQRESNADCRITQFW